MKKIRKFKRYAWLFFHAVNIGSYLSYIGETRPMSSEEISKARMLLDMHIFNDLEIALFIHVDRKGNAQ